MLEVQQNIIETLDKEISKIDIEIEAIIKQDQELENQYKLLKSIKGIDAITARFLIVYTWVQRF